MWTKLAVVSLSLNIFLGAALIYRAHFAKRTVHGLLAVPIFDFAWAEHVHRPELRNMHRIEIDLPDGGTEQCRIPSIAGIMASEKNRGEEPRAVVAVEIEGSDLGERCTAITTVSEGFVPTPK